MSPSLSGVLRLGGDLAAPLAHGVLLGLLNGLLDGGDGLGVLLGHDQRSAVLGVGAVYAGRLEQVGVADAAGNDDLIIGLYPRLQRLPLNRLLLVSLCLCDYGNTEKFAVSDTPCPVQNAKKEPESTGCNPVNSGSIVSLLGSVY